MRGHSTHQCRFLRRNKNSYGDSKQWARDTKLDSNERRVDVLVIIFMQDGAGVGLFIM